MRTRHAHSFTCATQVVCHCAQELGVPDRVGAQLSRLSQVLSITDLLAKTQPDPSLKAKISKARAAQAEAKQQQQQQQQQQQGKKTKDEKRGKASREQLGKEGKGKKGKDKKGKDKKGKDEGKGRGKKGGEGEKEKGGKVSKKQHREDLAAAGGSNPSKKAKKA